MAASLTDGEIMGDIGYGNDLFATDTSLDIRALLANDSRVESSFMNYQPIRQEPAGRNYRPDQFGTSDIGYPRWDPNDPINGNIYESGKLRSGNSSPVENSFQTAMQSQRWDQDISNDPNSMSANTYDTSRHNYYPNDNDTGLGSRFDMSKLFAGGKKENMTSPSLLSLWDNSIADVSNTTVLIILMFILFIIVAYMQNAQIQRLQNMVERIITKT